MEVDSTKAGERCFFKGVISGEWKIIGVIISYGLH